MKHSCTTVHLSLKATTFRSASSWLVIFWAEAAASSSTFSLASALSCRFLLSPRISQASTRDTGFRRPSSFRASEFFIHGSNTCTRKMRWTIIVMMVMEILMMTIWTILIMMLI